VERSVKRKDMSMKKEERSAAPRIDFDDRVVVEAQFDVGEYEVVVLSAEDALGLERWLKKNGYKIPSGAEPLFRPYIQQGLKFFVAKVNSKKVTFTNGQATLSPLRFHYDSEKFELPVRLGLINAKEKQDLIVHVLARGQRYEVANKPNATIPTNIDLVPKLLAAQYAIGIDDTLYLLKIGYDQESSKLSPGNLLLEWLIKRCHEDKKYRRINLITNLPWQDCWNPVPVACYNFFLCNNSPRGLLLTALLHSKKIIEFFQSHRNNKNNNDGSSISPAGAKEER
jgi:hypothetical protein